jgi:hypothetical protein
LIGFEGAPAGTSTTLAFAIAAPEGSVTCPRKEPTAVKPAGVWDTASVADNSNEEQNSGKQKYFRRIIPSFHSATYIRIKVFDAARI